MQQPKIYKHEEFADAQVDLLMDCSFSIRKSVCFIFKRQFEETETEVEEIDSNDALFKMRFYAHFHREDNL